MEIKIPNRNQNSERKYQLEKESSVSNEILEKSSNAMMHVNHPKCRLRVQESNLPSSIVGILFPVSDLSYEDRVCIDVRSLHEICQK